MKVVGAQKEQFQGKKRVNSQGFTHVVPNQSTQREVNTWGAKRVISGLKGMKLQNTKTQENTKSTCNKRMHGIWITKMAQTHQQGNQQISLQGKVFGGEIKRYPQESIKVISGL